MEITRNTVDEVLELGIEGRLDGYWADHLDTALAEAVRGGHHRIRLNLSQVAFLSSAGIGVMVKFYKQLAGINGSLVVVSPSRAVQTVLHIARLGAVLLESESGAPAPAPVGTAATSRRVERDGTSYEVFDVNPGGSLNCRMVGTAEPLVSSTFGDGHCSSLGERAPLLAVGVGAFGSGFADCRSRFGELLSVAGATVYQPSDGTNVADYLVASGPLTPDIRVLYCLACEGSFTRLVRFESIEPGGTVGLAHLVQNSLDIADAPAVGMVVVAEAASLVGAALRRSPAERVDEVDFFSHPGIRTRLTFTAERAFLRTLTLVAGVVARSGEQAFASQLRPLGGGGVFGHLHAAAFPFGPIRKGAIDFKDTVAGLFETHHPLGVLHLLHDDRGPSGAGESEFIRGACWVGPIAGTSSS